MARKKRIDPNQLEFVIVGKQLSSPHDRRMSGPPPKERFTVYTDGACHNNPGGPGAWAFIVLLKGEKIHESTGFDKSTTNNRMEIQAIIEGLKYLPDFSGVTVISDSQYAVNTAKRRRRSRHCANQDQWQLVDELKAKRFCDFKWVRGHSGEKWNEACDTLAVECLKRNRKK
jgi:ribonuclease HI